MRILVTGGSGFIGSNLSRKLVNMGNTVIITGCQTEEHVDGVEMLGLHFTGIDWNALGNIDIVFHEAANNDTLDKNAQEMFRANVTAPMFLFEELRKRGCRKYVYASSTAIYGDSPAPYFEDHTHTHVHKTPINPLNEYAKSKAEFEVQVKEFAKNEGVETCVGLRYCNIYGPGETHKGHRASMIYNLYAQMSQGKRPILFKNGEQKRDWCFIDDVVHANVMASSYMGCDVFNVGSGNARTFNCLIDVLNAELKECLKPQYIDNPYKNAYQSHTECNVDKAHKLLGWSPTYQVNNGIAEYVKRLKKDSSTE